MECDIAKQVPAGYFTLLLTLQFYCAVQGCYAYAPGGAVTVILLR